MNIGSPLKDNLKLKICLKNKEEEWSSHKKILDSQLRIMKRQCKKMEKKQEELKQKRKEQINIINKSEYSISSLYDSEMKSNSVIDLQNQRTHNNDIGKFNEQVRPMSLRNNKINYISIIPSPTLHSFEQFQTPDLQINSFKNHCQKSILYKEEEFKKRHLRIASVTEQLIIFDSKKFQLPCKCNIYLNLVYTNYYMLIFVILFISQKRIQKKIKV